MQQNIHPTLKKFTRYQVWVIFLLAITQFTVTLDFMVMSPLGDMLMKSMNLKPIQFGYAVSSYAFSAGISGLLTAGFADRFDRKKLLLFFYLGFLIGTLCCGLTINYSMLIAARIITGLFGGVISSVSMAIVADLFPLEQRGRVMGYMQMGFGTSQVLGIPIGLFIANIWGWQSPFLMIVGLTSIVWVIIFTKMNPVTVHLQIKREGNPLRHIFSTIQNRHYRIGFLTTALLAVGGFMMMPWGSAFAINNLGITEQELPFMFMIAGVSSLLLMPLIGKWSDKYDKFHIFLIASLWMSLNVIIYTNLSSLSFFVAAVANVLMMSGIIGRMTPASALVTELPAPQDRGAFMSINSSLRQFSGGIAAALGGMIVVQKTKYSPLEHYNTLGYILIGITVIAVIMVYRVSQIIKKVEKKMHR